MLDMVAEIADLRAALAASEARAADAEGELARAKATASCADAMIKTLKLEIAKLRREIYGNRSERSSRLLDQMELQLEELEAAATEDAIAAEEACGDEDAASVMVKTLTRRRSGGRKPFPEHLPRRRIVIEAPTSCSCCGSSRLRKVGEDVNETLEVIPRRWEVIQTVREKFSCRDCEKISQPPAPYHTIPRGWAGPSFLAMMLFEKFGQHQPLNRQAERYAREGVELSVSTLADQVGACAIALAPLYKLIEDHVFSAERLHGDDTTVPLLAKGRTRTARLWTYVRDDAPFSGGAPPPAAIFRFSRDRERRHPNEHLKGWSGVLQADAYAGYNDLYKEDRQPSPVASALCWAHARRKFFELADIAGNVKKGKPAHQISPVALEAVKRIDALFDIERGINGLPVEARLAARRELSAPLVASLKEWLTEERATMSKHNPVSKAIDYLLTKGRWPAFTRFLEDGRICLTNNAAERSLRGVALGRKSWLFAGSERGGDRAAFMYSLIVTAKLNDIDPQAWLADALRRLPDMPMNRVGELLPWNWKVHTERPAV